MLKNVIKGVLFIIFFSFFFLLAQKNAVKAACSSSGDFCGYACNGTDCPGFCAYSIYKWECTGIDIPSCCLTKTCQYGEYCDCKLVAYDLQCVYDSTCIQTKCSVTACTDWGPWGICSADGWSYRYCLTVDNDAYDMQQASFGFGRIDLL